MASLTDVPEPLVGVGAVYSYAPILVPRTLNTKRETSAHTCSLQAAAPGPLPGVHPVKRGRVREVGCFFGPKDRGG